MNESRDNSLRTPPYRVVTGRLVIRCWEPKDAIPLSAAIDASLEHLRAWIPWADEEPKTLEARIDALRSYRAKFDSDEDYRFGIFDRASGRVLGAIGMHTRRGPQAFEFGYWVAADSLRMGVASEAVAAMTRVGLEFCGRERIEVHIDVDNLASEAIPRRLGYTHEATRRKLLQPRNRDATIWTLFRDQYDHWPHRAARLAAFDAADRPIMEPPFSVELA